MNKENKAILKALELASLSAKYPIFVKKTNEYTKIQRITIGPF